MDNALRLLRRVGAQKLSLRALAKELGVTPMAIYRHVPNKQALLDEMRNSVIELMPIVAAQEKSELRAERPLSEAEIVEEALRIVRESGLSMLSMRALAKRLDVTAMSIYRYLPNKTALLSRMTDVLVAQLPTPTPTRDSWEQDFRNHAHHMWQTFSAYPGLIGSFAAGPSTTVLANMRYNQSILLASAADPHLASLTATTFQTFLLGLFRTHAYLDHLAREEPKSGVSTGAIRRYGDRLPLEELLTVEVDALIAGLHDKLHKRSSKKRS